MDPLTTAAIINGVKDLANTGISYVNNKKYAKRARSLLDQKRAGQQQVLNAAQNQLQSNNYNQALENRNIALSGLMGSSNPWGTASYSYAPTGMKLNGQDLMGATLNQQLNPQAQQLFNSLLGQFNTGNIGGLQLKPDGGYLQRNINRATPRWVQNRQDTERNLIARGITPNSPAWENAVRDLNKQEADERLGFEDKAFANDIAYQNHILQNQQNILGQLNNIQAPSAAGSLNGGGVDYSGLNQLAVKPIDDYNQYFNDLLDIEGNINRGNADTAKLALGALNNASGYFQNKGQLAALNKIMNNKGNSKSVTSSIPMNVKSVFKENLSPIEQAQIQYSANNPRLDLSQFNNMNPNIINPNLLNPLSLLQNNSPIINNTNFSVPNWQNYSQQYPYQF